MTRTPVEIARVEPPPIEIVGAGIAGLALALALARLGRPCTIREAADELRPIGAGIQLPPNAVKALRELGLERAVNGVASAPRDLRVHDGATGRRLTTLELGRAIERAKGAPYLVVHRGDLQAVLLDAIHHQPRIELRLGEPFDAATRPDDGSGRWLVGADGVRSKVRSLVRGGDDARPTGHVAWRADIDARDLPATWMRASVGVWLGSAGHVVHYPVDAGRRVNVVVSGPDDGAATPITPLSGWAGDVRPLCEAAPEWGRWPIATVPYGPGWTHGRVVLIGDAAHAMTPHAAQGGAMAIEDAITLAPALDAAIRERSQAPVRDWEGTRRPRVRRAAAAAERNRVIYQARGPLRWGRNLAMRLLPPAILTRGTTALYDWEAPPLRRGTETGPEG